jgi:uncharacterized protein YggE
MEKSTIAEEKNAMDGVTKRSIGALVLLILLFLFTACGGPRDTGAPRLITVIGDAEVRVAPDEAIVTLGVETWDKDLGVAKRQNDERVKKILALAKKYKIDPKNVQTDQIKIEPRYKEGYRREDFIGFFVSKNIVFTLKDIVKFEEVLSTALQLGANYVRDVRFRTSKLNDYREQARTLALKAAKEKAKAMAKELGQKVGRPFAIVEEEYDNRERYQNVTRAIGSAPRGGDTSIAFGQISVTAKVKVSFELR